MYNDITHIFIEHSVVDNAQVQFLIEKMAKPCTVIDDIKKIPYTLFDTKRVLVFAEQKGMFLRKCPCTPQHMSCNYWVLEWAVGCLFDCSYCYLQEYQNTPAIVVYVNTDALYAACDALLSKNPHALFRIGSGEFADSLFLDELTHNTGNLITYLGTRYDNYILEFKTKNADVSSLLSNQLYGREIVSWTLNPQCIVEHEEKKTASVAERINAAARCVQHGYYIGIHFDPLIMFDGCEAAYNEVIDALYDAVPAKRIAWISIGSLRCNPRLKPIAQYRHPETKIFCGEMIKGIDGKLRYFKPLRTALYRSVVTRIKQRDPNAFVYFCMEDQEVWHTVLGMEIKGNADVHALFCKRWEKVN